MLFIVQLLRFNMKNPINNANRQIEIIWEKQSLQIYRIVFVNEQHLLELYFADTFEI